MHEITCTYMYMYKLSLTHVPLQSKLVKWNLRSKEKQIRPILFYNRYSHNMYVHMIMCLCSYSGLTLNLVFFWNIFSNFVSLEDLTLALSLFCYRKLKNKWRTPLYINAFIRGGSRGNSGVHLHPFSTH